MSHKLSTMASAGFQALWKLIRFLFGTRTATSDVESAAGPVPDASAVSLETVKKVPVSTYRPEFTGVSALALVSTTAAALVPKIPVGAKGLYFPPSPNLPMIVVTPPDDEEAPEICKTTTSSRPPLRPVTNTAKRIYGQPPPRKRHGNAVKENRREHPQAPRCPQLPGKSLPVRPVPAAYLPLAAKAPVDKVKVSVAVPATDEWERQKAAQLAQAREWSERVQARWCSLPAPPSSSESASTSPSLPGSSASPSLARRSSAPARLSIQERLKRAVSGGLPSAASAPVVPLWGDAHVAFDLGDEDDEESSVNTQRGGIKQQVPVPVVLQQQQDVVPPLSPSSSLSSASAGSLGSILSAFEGQFQSSLWLNLASLEDLEEGHGARGEKVKMEDDDESDDHWSDVVSLEDYA
ncbi:hypothetical protein B0H11DRAFT_2193551 [Mycena galericulata]|nr:hypothetical protein B0H11DRAFT_2193551 [Mycena galericulata]